MPEMSVRILLGAGRVGSVTLRSGYAVKLSKNTVREKKMAFVKEKTKTTMTRVAKLST